MYLPKARQNWDEWWRELAPSKSLWKDYVKDKKIECLNMQDDSESKSETILRQ